MISRRKFLTHSSLALTGLAAFPIKVIASNSQDLWTENSRPLMGTLVSIAISNDQEFYNNDINQKIIDRTFSYIERVISKISCWSDSSDTGQLNSSRQLIAPSPELYSLLESSLKIKSFTNNSFSPTNGGLVKLWREAKTASSLPTKAEIIHKLNSAKNTTINLTTNQVTITGEGSLEFGGIGKGFIADCAAYFLRNQGVKYARVACSGDLRFIGDTSWIVDIQNPFGSGIIGSIELSGDLAVSTSGNYETAWSVNGKTYHHLLDLNSGYPSDQLCSVTTIAPNCTLADGLATAFFSMPPNQAISLSSQLSSVSVLALDQSGKVFHSPNLKFLSAWKV